VPLPQSNGQGLAFSVTMCDNGGMSTTEAPDDLPRGPDGIGYAMWIFRYIRDGRFEEIHIPHYGDAYPGGKLVEFREMRRRARALADEHYTPVAWADGTTSAMVNSNTWQPWGRSMWLVEWPRIVPEGRPVGWTVVACPNLETAHRGRP
jgi:hypothetical protein